MTQLPRQLTVPGLDGLPRDAIRSPCKSGYRTTDSAPCCGGLVCGCDTAGGCLPTFQPNCFDEAGKFISPVNPGEFPRTVYTYRVPRLSSCCGPASQQRFRSLQRRWTTAQYPTDPCRGQVIEYFEVSSLFDGAVWTRRILRRERLSASCTLTVTQDSTSVIPGLPCPTECNEDINTLYLGPFPNARSSTFRGVFRRDRNSYSGWLEAPSDGIQSSYNAWEAVLDPGNAGCVPDPCRRSCCLPNGRCIDGLSASECYGAGGVLNPAGVTCFAADCSGSGLPDQGACCDPVTGGCVITRPEDCLLPRIFRGRGSSCVPNLCAAPTGACCYGSGNSECTVNTQVACQALNGNWHGGGTACVSGLCTSPRACCLPDGSCANLQPEACLNAGGTGGPPNSSCGAGFSCQGACCCSTSHGRDCSTTTRQACLDGGCDYYGDNTVCSPGLCNSPPPGFRRSGRIFVPDTIGLTIPAGIVGCSGCGTSAAATKF